MLEVTLSEAYHMAGIDRSDSDMERDLKLAAWLDRRRWRCVMTQEELEQARRENTEVIIKKGNPNV